MTQLLFFDTFSHDVEDLNIDLVQFPNPVIVEEVRVIPLGARVQVNIGGGERRGATLPTRFKLEFFANDVTKPSASTFSSLGILPYDQNGQIHLNTSGRKVPTDGLVLRGLYSTITLAVYGIFTPTSAEQLATLTAANDEEHVQPPHSAPLPSAVVPHHHNLHQHHQHSKRNEWANNWPTERSLEATRSPVAHDRRHSRERSGGSWGMKNGQRSEPVNNDYNHHHHQRQHHHRVRSRSPRRNSRSVTRSPPPLPPPARHPPPPRRSVTPKSPLQSKNGYASPERNEVKPPSVTEDPVALDDMSDISDGDIPDETDVAEIGQQEEVANIQDNSTECEDKGKDSNVIDDFDARHFAADIPEDMEAISDEEADWSDDGDCFFLDPESYRVDFGSGWVEPITIYKTDEHVLLPLKHHHQTKTSRASSKEASSDNTISKLNDCTLSSDWVETLETVDVKVLETTSKDILQIFRRGLCLSEALKQPVHTFKLRHLKSSLKFANEILATTHLQWEESDMVEIMQLLMNLLMEKSIVPPLLVNCLSAIHRTLNYHPNAIHYFKESWTPELVNIISDYKLTTRLKVGFSTLLQRINIIESWTQLSSLDFESSLIILKQLLNKLRCEHEPKLSFLSNDKCGIIPHLMKDMLNLSFLDHLYNWCQANIDEHNDEVTSVVDETLSQLIRTKEGLLLAVSCPVALNKILALFRNHKGIRTEFFAFCFHSVVKLDHMCHFVALHNNDRRSLETTEVLTYTQELYGMTFSNVGREAVVHVLSLADFLRPLLSLVKHSGAVDDENQQKKDMKKSAIRGYACELVLMVIRLADDVEYLSNFTDELIAIGKSDENSKLFEIVTWLSFLSGRQDLDWSSNRAFWERPKLLASGIGFFSGTVKQNIEHISPMSCELVMAIRFLLKIICSEESRSESTYALLHTYAHEMGEHSISILNKICGYHEQPHLHTATFAGFNGDVLATVIRLLIKLLKKTLIYRIECQDDGFRDTTCIPTLLRTFTLCTVVPKNSASYNASVETRHHLLDILLAFTSVSLDMGNGKASNPWQNMVSEVVKYVTHSPHTYTSGLKILSQLLPLPLPLTLKDDSDEESVDNAIVLKQRNLWSAQLFAISHELHGMLIKLIPAKVEAVQKPVYQVCRQLADLSAPIATIVAEAVASSVKDDNSEFLTPLIPQLLSLPPIKAAFLTALSRDNSSSDLLKNTVPSKLSRIARALLDPQLSLEKSELLPDFENSVLLLTSLISEAKSSSLACVSKCLSNSLSGLYLVKQCFLRHKVKVADLLKVILTENSSDDFNDMCDTLIALSKYVSHAELQEFLSGVEDFKEENEKLQSLYDILKTSEDIQEELEINWPTHKPLLEQFKGRAITCKKELVKDDENLVFTDNTQSAIPFDLTEVIETSLPKDFDIQLLVKQVCDEKSLESERQKKKAAKKSLLESKAIANKNLISNFKAGRSVSIRGGRSVFNRGPGGQRSDLFRSRPPNTSRPPSLHVDDFLVLQSRGQQPTGPTGYNKQSLKAAQELFAEKEAKSKGSIVGFREATKEPVLDTFAPPLQSAEIRPPPRPSQGQERTKGYRNVSGNGRTFHRERYGAPSGGQGASSGGSRGWPPSPSREGGGRSGGGGGRPFNHNRRNAKGQDSRRGGKDRNKGKSRIADGPRSGNLRSMPR